MASVVGHILGAGIAWEVGLVTGLAEGGIDLRDAGLVVGTSAGSVVGTRLAAGQDLSKPAPAEVRGSESAPQPDGGPDLTVVGEIFRKWSSTEVMTEEVCAEIGALALAARTIPERVWIDRTGGGTGVTDWPETPLRITSVDANSGVLMVHDRHSGVPLQSAVGSSCAVPGLFPPITIGGRRYMDGGVRSGTNADVAIDVGPDVVLIIAPICARTASFGPLAERCMRDEADQLSSAGVRVCIVIPEDAEVEAFGPNLMDAGRAESARAAGRARGLGLAGGDAAIWRS